MQSINLDKVILGHNQFFGINHMSQEKGALKESYFRQLDNIMGLIKHSIVRGAGGLMLSTHPQARLIVEAILKDDDIKEHLNLYVLLPYMAKYVRMANEKGIVNMISDTLGQATLLNKIQILTAGSLGVLKKDIMAMFRALIDVELLLLSRLNVKAIFLHNALTDMAVGLDLFDILEFFIDYIDKKYHVSPAFCTLNSPMTLNYLDKHGIKNPVLMAPFNPIGFQMNPSREAAENSLRTVSSQTIAMSTLAAGFISPAEAAAYLSSLPEIKSIVIGASSRKHIDESFAHLKNIFNND